MPFDEPVLSLQRRLDRLVRRLRVGPPPPRGRRRLLIVQIDGLARAVLERALAERRTPFLRRLVERHGFRLQPMSVGLPTSTPAFQLAAMYGVRPDIPGFHYHDKRRRADVYFPRGGDAAWVEDAQARGRRGIVDGGSTYGCVFTGGAANNLFSFARITRPSGAGLVRAVSAGVVLIWVVVKAGGFTALELMRAVVRFVADPVGHGLLGWKWLGIRLAVSVWLRELFTLAVSRDLYAGVPAIYVNYLDYDVAAHSFGPRHRRALRALRRVDRSIRQLWRVLRRVPEHGYDLYVLSDHGQLACTPYERLTDGVRIEWRLVDEFFAPAAVARRAAVTTSPGLARTVRAYRAGHAPGMLQRFLNYLQHDFLRTLGETPQAHEHDDVRVIAAGPNVFVYFLESPEPLDIEWIDARYPGVADDLAHSAGIGFVLARSKDGPVCLRRGKRYRLSGDAGPFASRADREVVVASIRDLMAMPSAGDLVIYGNDAPEGHVSYIAEIGAHAGPSPEELNTFIVGPETVHLPSPITHPTQLYAHFATYHEG